MTTSQDAAARRRRAAARRAESAAVLGQLAAGYDEAFRWVGIYDDEARAAIARHPDAADVFCHTGQLLARPYWLTAAQPFAGGDNETAYRGYVRELAERLATGQDTRPGTAVEILLALARFTAEVKAPAVIKGLYHRMWMQAFPDHPETAAAAEVLAWDDRDDGSGIRELEAEMRRRLRQPRRKLPDDLTCDGHHGPCRFTPALEGS